MTPVWGSSVPSGMPGNALAAARPTDAVSDTRPGIANSYSKLKAQLDYLEGRGGGDFELDSGTYGTDQPVLIPPGVRLVGEDPANTRIQAIPGFSGAAVVMNKYNDGTQEYAWLENVFVHGAALAPVCVLFDTLFVNSGIEKVIAAYSTDTGVVYKAAGGSGPLFMRDIWSLHHANDCMLIDSFVRSAWLQNITTEYMGNGKAGLRVRGANTDAVLVTGLHAEHFVDGVTAIPVIIDGAQNVEINNLDVQGGNAGNNAWSDIVQIINTVGGTPSGIVVRKIRHHSGGVVNLVNDTVNGRVIPEDAATHYLEEYRTDPIWIDKPRAVGAVGQPAFAADFANFAGSRPLVFYKDASGLVHIEGTITTPAGQAANTAIFTLPVGYRPGGTFQPIQFLNSTAAAFSVKILNTGVVQTGALLGAGNVFTIHTVFSTL